MCWWLFVAREDDAHRAEHITTSKNRKRSLLVQTKKLVSTEEGGGGGPAVEMRHGGQTVWASEKEWKRGRQRFGQKTKGRCHVGPESLIDVMYSAAHRQWFR